MNFREKSFRVLRSFCLIFVLLLGLTSIIATGGGGDSGDNGSNPPKPRFDELTAALQEDLENSNAYGVSAAVMENGVVTYAQAFGYKDQNRQVPLTPDTLMQIGSTTKQMTAVSLLQKVEAGQVSLDDTLEETLPLFEFEIDGEWDDRITIHHLLSHQSGITEMVPWEGLAADTELADWTYEVFDKDYYIMNPPGIFFNYSNPNFSLAGLIVESLDDRFWPDIMREDIFLPLGMERTFCRKSEVDDDGDFAVSYGYGLGPDSLLTQDQGPVEIEFVPDSAWVRPAGLVWTTPTQMMRWARFLMKGDAGVLSDELRAEITSKQVDQLDNILGYQYGYGMSVADGYLTRDGIYYKIRIWQHGGGTLSFTHSFYILPDYDFAISICASGRNADFRKSLNTAITTLVDLPAASPAPEYEFDPEKLDNHAGTYINVPPAPYTNDLYKTIVTRNDDSLYVYATMLTQEGIDYTPKLTTVSSDKFIFYVDGKAYDLTFIPEEEGGVSKYIRNRSYVGTRVE